MDTIEIGDVTRALSFPIYSSIFFSVSLPIYLSFSVCLFAVVFCLFTGEVFFLPILFRLSHEY